MKKMLETLVMIWLVLNLLLLTGCAAVNYPQMIKTLDPALTIRGMQQAINGMPNTYALVKDGMYVFGWPQGAQYAWVVFKDTGDIVETVKGICGNKACPEIAGDLYNWLLENGWNSISCSAVPATIASTVRQFSFLLSIGASLPTLPVIIVFPALLDPAELIQPKVQA